MSGRKRKRDGTAATVASTKANPSDSEVFTRWLIKSEPLSRIEKGVDVKFGLEVRGAFRQSRERGKRGII